MSETIIVAIIGAFATIVAAIIAHRRGASHQHANPSADSSMTRSSANGMNGDFDLWDKGRSGPSDGKTNSQRQVGDRERRADEALLFESLVSYRPVDDSGKSEAEFSKCLLKVSKDGIFVTDSTESILTLTRSAFKSTHFYFSTHVDSELRCDNVAIVTIRKNYQIAFSSEDRCGEFLRVLIHQLKVNVEGPVIFRLADDGTIRHS